MADSNSNETGDSGKPPNTICEINRALDSTFKPLALDFHPFQVGWYNELVGPKFLLEYPPTTLAYVVISGPSTFEKSVLPYLREEFKSNSNRMTNDPLDDAMVHAFTSAKQELKSSGFECVTFHDFDLYPSRRPKILVQTAAHVAGAVQYFHKNNLPLKVQEERFSKQANLCGVAIHPKYGGWFAIRGVFILPQLILKEEEQLTRPQPLNLIKENEKVASLLEEFAYNWESDNWRKVYTVGDGSEYSQDFKDFLAVLPGERWDFIKQRGLLNVPL